MMHRDDRGGSNEIPQPGCVFQRHKSLKNTKTKPTSSVILVWAFIRLSWWPLPLKYKRNPGKEGSAAVRWIREGNPEYTLELIEKDTRGTDIILHVAEDSVEFLENERIAGLLEKMCLPIPIQFGTKDETIEEGEGEEKTERTIQVDNIINTPDPAWRKQPADLTDEDYRNFYHELYPHSYESPLFWIHLNIDYPFTLNGILYFPNWAIA